MKTTLIAIGLLLTSAVTFSQRVIDEKIDVKHINLPLTVMPGVSTYNCIWNAEAIQQDIPGIDTEMGYNQRTVVGFMAIQGYTFTNVNPDVTITLESNRFTLPTPEFIDIDESPSGTNFRAKYAVPLNWTLNIDGKFAKNIDLSTLNKTAVVLFPPEVGSYGQPGQVVPNAEAIEKHIAQKMDNVEEYVKNQAIQQLFNLVKQAIQSELSYTPTIKEIEVQSFKTTKKEDFTAWDKPYERAQELLKSFDKGESPTALYDAYKDIFDFWSAQIEQHKGDLKTHKKILRVATHNMLELLALVNPEVISQESIDLYTEVNYNNKDLFKAIEKNKKRFAANVGHATDYAKLSELPPLNKNCYNVMYTTSKGDQKPGIIKYSTPYGLDPSETGKAFKIYDLATYTSANGGVTDKHMLDPKEIASYEILGMKYVKTKFTDPTAVSFSGNEEFLEEVITGKLSLYKNYIIEEGGAGSTTLGAGISLTTGNEAQKPNIKPLFVIKYGKKSTVVFNYSKLADILDDCKTVSDKIKDGAYGNKQVAEKTSKLGKFVQQGTHSEISEEVILKITEEFNALM